MGAQPSQVDSVIQRTMNMGLVQKYLVEGVIEIEKTRGSTVEK